MDADSTRPRILIVDDNADILQTTAALLEHAGYEPVTVNRASEILTSIRRVHPALVLQDVYMPDLELGATIKSLRADPDVGGTPLLLFTASVDGEDIVGRVGADGILRKPFDIDQLSAMIMRHLKVDHAAAARPTS